MPAKRSPEVLQALSLIREGFSIAEASRKSGAVYNTVRVAMMRERRRSVCPCCGQTIPETSKAKDTKESRPKSKTQQALELVSKGFSMAHAARQVGISYAAVYKASKGQT